MYLATQAIVLHRTAYSDSYDIIHIYTTERGRMGILLPSSNSRRQRAIRTQLSPLTQVELELEVRAKQNLARVKECRVIDGAYQIRIHPTKCSIALYLAELLYRTLTHTESDPELYQFVAGSLSYFDTLERSIANFHLCFTLRLLEYLAISPKEIVLEQYTQGYWLDLEQLNYTLHPQAGGYALSPIEVEHLIVFIRMNYRNMHLFRYNRQTRRLILERLLSYYRLHLPHFPELKSVSILSAPTS